MRYNRYMITVRRLVWDNNNIDHIDRHNVTKEEVEEVCQGEHVAVDAHYGRVMVIGPTFERRAIAVILDPEREEGVWYPVTARSADRQERRKYFEEKGVKL